MQELGETFGGGKLLAVVVGGDSRQESVRLGLDALPETCEIVAIHDAARCCITPELIESALRGTEPIAGYATLAIPVTDSLLRLGDGESVPREGLWCVQTPQAFRHIAALRAAHRRAAENGVAATDDFSLLGGSGYVKLGSAENLKVTTPEDLTLAEAILRSRGAGGSGEMGSREWEVRKPIPHSQPLPTTPHSQFPTPQTLRVGHGYDVHRFAEGRPMWLGGVHFPESDLGLDGHSDADVVLHALCDALLGAAGLPDIGQLFPPSDMAHKNRASIEFLSDVKTRLDAGSWGVENVDLTIIAETPKIGPRAAEIKNSVARALGITSEQVSVKATTNETMGFVGRREGIAAHATVLLSKRS